MFNKLFFILLMQSLFFAGCSFNNSPEHTVNNIITYYNNGDIEAFWNMVLPDDRYAVSSSMIANIDNNDLFNIMAYALNKDNITPENLSSEEYLYGSFKIILGDKDMELIDIEQIDTDTYSADVQLGEKYAVIPLKRLDGNWYMRIKK